MNNVFSDLLNEGTQPKPAVVTQKSTQLSKHVSKPLSKAASKKVSKLAHGLPTTETVEELAKTFKIVICAEPAQ